MGSELYGRSEVRTARDAPASTTIDRAEAGPFARAILVILPTAAALGGMASLGGPFLLFRVAAVLLAVGVFLVVRPVQDTAVGRWCGRLVVIWSLTALAQMVLSGTNTSIARELGSLVPGLALMAACARMASPSAASALRMGWILAFAVTAVIGMWELTSGEHLGNYYLDAQALDELTAGGIASTLGNPNNYAFFLCCSLPILLASASSSKPLFRWACVLGAAATVPLMVATESRLGAAVLVLEACVYFVYLRGGRLRLKSLILSITMVGVAYLVTPGLASTMTDYVSETRAELQQEALSQEFSSTTSSGGVRLNLALNGLDFAADSYLLGVGPGGFETKMVNGEALRPTAGIVNPHNGWVEIFSQYGAHVLLFFVALLLSAFRTNLPVFSEGKRVASVNARVVVPLVASTPVLITLNSTFLLPSISWMMLATVVLLAVVGAARKESTQ